MNFNKTDNVHMHAT